MISFPWLLSLLPGHNIAVTRERAAKAALIAATFFAFIVPCVPSCQGGGGPENVLLLVNSNSQDSLTLANHYIDLRKIPASNVLYLPYKGSKTEISGVAFRNKILIPAFTEIKNRKLESQIDYIVYSCDFPWRVFFKSDFPDKKLPTQLAPRGSLTGLTYLSAFVMAKRQEVVSPNANLYFTKPLQGITISRAFRSRYRWAQGGKRAGAHGLSYMISSMLGVTDVRGNTVSEIIHCLRRAQQADGTKPAGTVYYMKHAGPRSSPRHKDFAMAAASLRSSGVATKVVEGKFPANRPAIAGLTCGVAYANLGSSGCRFVPGAYCDNFTSFGAMFGKYLPPINVKTGKKSQYQLSVADFVRHGATAASGTVFEPYNIAQKFPHPCVHVHYANGCSLGESFYQSVSGPYQQLLVGDPLCQPWASMPVVEADELREGALLSGQVEITPKVRDGTVEPVKQFELFVDGRSIQSCAPGNVLTLDTTSLEDGHHEVRIVATTAPPIETQGRLIVGVRVKNGQDAIGMTVKSKRISYKSEKVELNVVSTSPAHVDIFCNRQKVGSVPTGSGTVSVATDKLGTGPVKFIARSPDVRSSPLLLEITP